MRSKKNRMRIAMVSRSFPSMWSWYLSYKFCWWTNQQCAIVLFPFHGADRKKKYSFIIRGRHLSALYCLFGVPLRNLIYCWSWLQWMEERGKPHIAFRNCTSGKRAEDESGFTMLKYEFKICSIFSSVAEPVEQNYFGVISYFSFGSTAPEPKLSFY